VMSLMNTVLFNYVVDGVIVDGPMPYQTVLARTGLKDTVGFTERGYLEHFEPQPEPELPPDHIAQAIRAMRTEPLRLSDWTQMSDSPLTAEKKAEWKVYRQALRDLPDTWSSATDPFDVVLPQPPN